MMFTEQKLYEDGGEFFQIELSNHYIDYIKRDSDILFVTFDGMKPKAPKGELYARKPWAAKFIGDQGYDHVGVKLKRLDWYRCPELHRFWRDPALIDLLSSYTKVIFYGLSMGGYAALVFSSVLKGSHVLALVPQTTLDLKVIPWDKRFPRGNEQDWTGDFADAVDFIGNQEKIYVMYDPFFVNDADHVKRLPADKIVKIKAPCFGHNLDSILVPAKLMKEVPLHAVAEDLEAWFPKAVRIRKRFNRYNSRVYGCMAFRSGVRQEFPKAIEYAKRALQLDMTNKLALQVAKRLQEILK